MRHDVANNGSRLDVILYTNIIPPSKGMHVLQPKQDQLRPALRGHGVVLQSNPELRAKLKFALLHQPTRPGELSETGPLLKVNPPFWRVAFLEGSQGENGRPSKEDAASPSSPG